MSAHAQQTLPGCGGILPTGELVVDLFAGCGGASAGIEEATGRDVDVACNHDATAIACHAANHPAALHLQADIRDVHPLAATRGQPVAALHASPDCRHFSRAKGRAPVSRSVRSLASVVLRWARHCRPRIITLENVQEFTGWGPLIGHRPDPARRGHTFHRWVFRLRRLGYVVEWRTLRACDYGVPTTRERMYLIARRDGQPIDWPHPTHGPGRAQPHRTAAECIDWSIPTRSIFTRPRPLAGATCRRIAQGLVRYVLDHPQPYIVRIGQQSSDAGKVHPITHPLTTITTKAEHCLVTPWLAKHYTGVVGQKLRAPLGTVTAVDHHSLCAAFLVKYYGQGGQSQAVDEPLHAITTIARHGLVLAHIDGQPYRVVDIGMRMLEPRELARAQGLPTDYVLPATKRDAIRLIGNSVCPPVITAIYRSNLPSLIEDAA